MPKELTHWLLAERSLAGLDSRAPLARLIRENRALYLVGAVLPDTLLHIIRGKNAPSALALANRFHDAAENSYAPLIRIEEQFGSERIPPGVLACLLGVLSHMQTDIVFHPLVFSRCGLHDTGCHYRMETGIDTWFVRQGADFPTVRLDSLMTPAVRESLVTVMALLFDPEGSMPRQTLELALNLHCRIQAMFDNTIWKLVARLLSPLPLPLFRDAQHLFYPLNRHGNAPDALFSSWCHPVTGIEIKESPDDLAKRCVERTVSLFRSIDAQGCRLKTSLTDPPGENLLTGLHGVRQKMMEKQRP